jgi:hypothetical protein
MKVIVEFECNEHADHPELVKKIFQLGEQKMLKIKKIEIIPFE